MRHLTIPEAVAYLAARGVTRRPATIRWWIGQGYLRAVRVRGRLYVTDKDVLRAERETRRRAMRTRRVRHVSRETSDAPK